MMKSKKPQNNTMVVMNEQSHFLDAIYDAAKHGINVKSRHFLILYIMPTLSFHYWNIIRKSAEQSSQNQIKVMLNNIKTQVKQKLGINSKTILKYGNPQEILSKEIIANEVQWLWCPDDLGKEYIMDIVRSVRDDVFTKADKFHLVLYRNRNMNNMNNMNKN